MNTKFVLRGLMLALPATVALTVIGLSLMLFVGPPPEPTPPPPTILAPRGKLPVGPLGFQEWARYRGEGYRLVGSGFLLRLSDGQTAGVTTAHSLMIGNPDHPLQQIAFGVAGQTSFVAEFNTLRGQPGRARRDADMTVDYVLLQPHQPIDPGFVLTPDPRGAPQPGERVWLINGQRDADSGQRMQEGTVHSVSHTAVWVMMDKSFYPGLASGSPFVSQHTGQVVGMLIAGSLRGRRLLLGAHPIDSLVRLAESADGFFEIDEYSR
jgi:hypothetical protein